MGGLGSGGHAAAGRKPKNAAAERLTGRRSEAKATKLTDGQPVGHVPVPADLEGDDRKVWKRLAPDALKARTLTPATALAFALLCQNIALERRLRIDPEKCAGSNHRGILQRVEAGLTAFGLRALGKPMAEEATPPVDPFNEFDDGAGSTTH